MQSYEKKYFFHKKSKWLLRNRICQKNLTIFTKIKQIHALQSLPTSKIQCGCFSYFSNFRKATENERVFWTSRRKIFKKYTKSVLNLLNSTNLNTFRTCHTSKNQLKWFSKKMYVFINEWFSKGFIGRMYWNYVNNAWISKEIRQRTIHS